MPDARLFVDVDSIETGEDFAEAIYEAIDSCRVLVVLIGPKWATLLDEEGRRRLDDPGDYVRFEVRVALQRGILVIPVLVDGAKPLRHQQLPSDLRQLARLNALELSHTRYDYDVTRLVELIQGTLASASSNVHQSIAMANAEIRAEKSSLRAQFATYPPQLLALWKAQYRARDLMPYRSLAGDAPLLSTLYIEQAVEGKTKEYRSSPRPQSIAEALAIHRHILIIGDPGSGKSTSLYQLAAQAAAWWTGNTSKPILDPSDAPSGLTVPVRVSAQALIGNSLSYAIKKSVMEDLAEYLDLPVLSADIFAQEPLPSIPWLIMIDGIMRY